MTGKLEDTALASNGSWPPCTTARTCQWFDAKRPSLLAVQCLTLAFLAARALTTALTLSWTLGFFLELGGHGVLV